MEKKKSTILVGSILTIFLVFTLLTAGCENQGQKQEFQVPTGQVIGSDIRVIFLPDTSQYCGPRYSAWMDYAKSYCAKYQLIEIVNSGKYNIIKTNTIYDNNGYLVTAEIYYKVG